MSLFREWLDPVRRFERAYGLSLAHRFETMAWPGGLRLAFDRLLIPRPGLRAALAAAPQVLVTGTAGLGKTTALGELARREAHALAAGRAEARVPIWLAAREWSGGAWPRPGDLLTALGLSPALAAQSPREFFQKAVASGRAWLLVDDLDALPDEQIAALLKEYAGVRLTATAGRSLPGLKEFALPGLRDHEIANWVRRWEPGQAGALIAALKTDRVPRSLTGSPMGLTLLRQVWQPGRALPTSRTALFETYARQVLNEKEETAKTLKAAALDILRGRPASNGLLSKGQGWLRAGRNHSADFCHILWRAYFAARALRETPDPELFSEWLQAPQWEETVLFYAGWGDATPLVRALVERGDAGFAGRVVAHAQEVEPTLRDQVVGLLIARAWDGQARSMLVLSELNSQTAVDAWGARLKDPDAGVRAQAALRLGELQLDRGVDYLLPALRDRDSEVRAQAALALGRARTDRVIEPLIVALRGESQTLRGDTRLRAAAAAALGEVGSDRAAPALIVDLQGAEPEVRAAAAQALKQITGSLVVKPLHALLQSADETSRRYATEILEVVG